MAFAGNDLVNFIGVPLAGFSSYQAFVAEPGADPSQFLMTSLTGKVHTETYLLIIAGLVMAVTLWFSRKARTVADTEINLGRQGEGDERFGASTFSKNLVRGAISIITTVERFVPKFVKTFATKRFAEVDKSNKNNKKSKSSFDLIRASVNLTVASILISFATSLKLPLSTTYVTFMVAMGSSFGDGAWGRESAVYRVSGVTSVIGGWFLTAFLAFIAAFTFAYIISYGGVIALTGLIILAVIFIIKTHTLHRKRETEKEKEVDLDDSRILRHSDVVEKSSRNIIQTLEIISKAYTDTIKGLAEEDRKSLKNTREEVEALNKKVKKLKNKIHRTINNLREEAIETGHYYVQVLDYLREMAHCLTFMLHKVYKHIDNNHKGLSAEQIEEFEHVALGVEGLLSGVLNIIKDKNFDEIGTVITNQQELLSYIGDLNRIQLKRIKHGESGTRNGLLYLGVLAETKSLLLQAINLLKAERDFIIHHKVL
jgi:Na+/phosphate symporter